MDIIINDKPCQGKVGEKLSRVAQDNKAHVGYVCAGLGICQTCYVTVFEGMECLSPLSEVETAFLSEKQIGEGARLACQATIVKDGVIRLLSRPEEVRRMVLQNPLSLFSYSVDLGQSAAERFIPGVTNVIDRIQKGEMHGEETLDEALSSMGSALLSSIDTARESIPFKEQISAMVDSCKKMLPFFQDSLCKKDDVVLEEVKVNIPETQTDAFWQAEKPATGMSEFEDLGFVVADSLAGEGIQNCSELLQKGKDPKGREGLAEKTGMTTDEIATIVKYADLRRVSGIDMKTAELLQAAGVDSVPELAQRNPANLARKIKGLNQKKKYLDRLPAEEVVRAWILDAKNLPRIVEY